MPSSGVRGSAVPRATPGLIRSLDNSCVQSPVLQRGIVGSCKALVLCKGVVFNLHFLVDHILQNSVFLSAGGIFSPLSGPGRSCLFLTAVSNTSSFVLLYCWGISIASASLPSDNLGEVSFLQQGQPPQQLHCSAWAPVAGVSRSPHCPLVASSRPAGYVTWSLSAKGRANMS